MKSHPGEKSLEKESAMPRGSTKSAGKRKKGSSTANFLKKASRSRKQQRPAGAQGKKQ